MSAPNETRAGPPRPDAPRTAQRLLRAVVDAAALEPYLGDLLELFDDRLARDGPRRARHAFWRDTGVALLRLPWRRPTPRARRTGDPMLTMLATDLRHAARRLRRAPAFALLSGLTLALGIGATTAVFSVAYSALLRPLPFPDAGRLVDAAEFKRGTPMTVSPSNFADWQRTSRTMDLAASGTGTGALTSDGPAEQLAMSYVTAGFFSVMGVKPELGRAFNAAETAYHGPKAVMLGHRLWARRFGSDAHVIGHTIRLDGESRVVVGVMPDGFDFPEHSQLWVPLAFSEQDLATQRGAHWLSVTGRLKPGAAVERANAELAAIHARLAAAYPEQNTDESALVRSLRDATVGDVRPALIVLLGAVGLLLLLACANVANLLLVRATRHERDRVVRAALGAGRGRLAGAVMSEAVILSFVGAMAGVALAWWGTHLLDATLRAARPTLAESRVDGPVLLFALGVALLTAFVFGVLPALSASRLRDIATVLRAATPVGARGRPGRHWGSRLRGSLVVAQIAITTLLLSGAALLGESFLRLRQVDVGFDPNGVWTFSVSLPDARYEGARVAQFYRELTDRIRALPGVRAVGATMGLPLSGMSYTITLHELDGVPEPSGKERSTSVRMITDGYFRAVGMRVVRGRAIERTDDASAPRVVVVNETLARRLWPGQDPIGRRFSIGMRVGPDSARERVGGIVVGVVGDVHGDGLRADPRPEAYFPEMQFPMTGMMYAVRGEVTPGLRKAMAAQVAALDPEIPVFQERTLDTLVADAVAEPRLYSLLFAAFAGTALVLAAVGVYGVVSLSVGQRTRELGVRVALGARAGDVARLVLRQGMTPVAFGLAVGLVGAFATTRLLTTMLFGVSATDPAAFAVVCAALMGAAAAAVWLPTRRATTVAPTEALRSD
ncbi:permease (plasmid) [Gemmatirosa kalamazoonensis]|uniref:Permease n=1 Tax=Gemmatirosa kalamazoonensis TaxID=861299 RepID=W0RTJ1_9BACT|nr:ABC transporter permease [Gemmatirosa kalamazoonensis]AHG93762.1 permease [Gemmatirosa kalamazoonensis]